ncbi:MAG: reverse transcriptase domain-containing protein [Bacilli bacterium]
MENEINFDNILKIYDNEISKHVKNYRKLRDFELNKMQNINNICCMLKKGYVGHTKYNIFLIYEPKCRLIVSLDVTDKVINQFICRYSLEPNLTKYLDFRNSATRKNMGTDYAINLVIKFIEKCKRKGTEIYALKIDISKYFYNINHDILKGMLKDKLCPFEYDLICKIIDSTDYEYVNDSINSLCELNNIDMPRYKKGRGIGVGLVTSQFLSIFYLSKIDHYIVNDLKLPLYSRYMDDFLILSNDLKKLKKAKRVITKKLKEELDLDINKKKTKIYNLKNGVTFLGYIFKVNENGKTIVLITKSNFDKVKRRVKQVRYDLFKGFISHESALSSIMTYSNCYIHSNNRKVLNIIEKSFYNE